MDSRLRCAVDASVGWYDDLCSLHGVGSQLVDGLWSSLSPPPRLHSDAVVVEPEVGVHDVLERLAGRDHAGVKDSFATMDLTGEGMRLLFSASWIYRPAPERPRPDRAGLPVGWRVVTTAGQLADWTARHDTTGVLLPGLLRSAHFRVLGKYDDDDRLVIGAVARLGSGVVDVSNVFAAPDQSVDWAELADVVAVHFPERPLVGYERDVDLAAALEGGFVTTGENRVWLR